MRDLVFVVATGGFFIAAGLLVKGCDRIVGPDPEPQVRSVEDADGQVAGR